MRQLADLQGAFADILLSPQNRNVSPGLLTAVEANGALPEDRLSIYRNNVYSRLIEALEASYPAVERLVGREFFRYAAREYIAVHPPRTLTLLGYGNEFSDFLAKFAPAASVPYLADVARLEQCYLAAYHAAEGTSIDKDRFAAMLAGGDRDSELSLHPSAHLMESIFPVSRIWELNRQPDAISEKIRIRGEHEYLLVIRPDATVEVRRLKRGVYAALAALARGAPFSEAIAAGSASDPGIDLRTHLSSLAEGATFCLRERTL
jgi:hypothetical protein